MYQLYACVTQRHDPFLVCLAAILCFVASWTALYFIQRSRVAVRWRDALLAYAAVIGGAGMWATHFTTLLAYETGLPVEYDGWLTLSSLLAAIVIAGAGFTLAVGGGTRQAWLGGAVVGMGLGVAHYLGMDGMQVAAVKSWDVRFVAASLLVGVPLCAAALRVSLSGNRPGRVWGAVLLTGAICGLHLIGMAGIDLQPTPLLAFPDSPSSSRWLEIGIATASALILSSSTAMIMGQHFAHRDRVRLRALVDATFEGLVIHLDGVILDVNQSLAKLLGVTRDDLLGREFGHFVTQDWTERTGRYLSSQETAAHETELLHADGSRVGVELLSRAIEYQGSPARVIAVRDLSERRLAAEHVRRLAYYDMLTGLPNRVLLREHVEGALARGRRGGAIAILCLGLDRFKSINDVLGHSAGDAVLRAVAKRLRSCTRETDFVARLGGDEFVIVQEYAVQPQNATALARRLNKVLADPIVVEDRKIEIGASIGIAMAGEDTRSAETVLKGAGLALARAKTEGGGSWRFFEEEMDERMQARWSLEKDLRAALVAGQFEVYYQPLIAARDCRVLGFEALLRWNHPVRGMVLPSAFIPAAEEMGVIGQIGAWVLRKACSEAVSWPGDLKISVNLSPAQFRSRNLAADISTTLAETGLDPARLELEVTESLLLGDDPSVLLVLHELHSLGVSIAMDDFGTGYSSLSYLRRFPFDKIKIDRCFVSDLVEHEESRAIVRAIAELGRALAIRVNAEGVETEGQFAVLRASGCQEVQGYLFSKPRPASEIPALLEELRSVWRETRSEAAFGELEGAGRA